MKDALAGAEPRLPGGGMLIDTPGMRELQLWDTGDAVSQVFDEIEALAPDCRFRDCAHQSEPGCAVQAALAAGRAVEQQLIGALPEVLLAHRERLHGPGDESRVRGRGPRARGAGTPRVCAKADYQKPHGERRMPTPSAHRPQFTPRRWSLQRPRKLGQMPACSAQKATSTRK